MSNWVDNLARRLGTGEEGRLGRISRRTTLSKMLGAVIAASPLAAPNLHPQSARAGGKCKKNKDCRENQRCRHGRCERDGDGGGGGERKLTAERLSNKDRNQIEQRAQNNRDFNLLREYFAHDDGRDWRQHGSDGCRIRKNGDKERDAFWTTLKNPKGDQWVHVMFGRENGGSENAVGLLWRGDGNKGKYSNVFYVQNGNIRNDNGRVDGADVSAQSVPDDLDQLVCPFVTLGSCALGTGVLAAACMVPILGIPECAAGAVALGGCTQIAGDSNAACKKIDGS